MIGRVNYSFGKDTIHREFERFWRDGAIIWPFKIGYSSYNYTNQNPPRYDCKPSSWNWFTDGTKMIYRFPQVAKMEKDNPLILPNQLVQFIRHIFQHTEDLDPGVIRRGTDRTYIRWVSAHRNPPQVHEWHRDNYDSLTLIVPLVPFTLQNGCTEVKLQSHRYRSEEHFTIAPFIGNPFEPLIMSGEILHRQRSNFTSLHRYALIVQLDRHAFQPSIPGLQPTQFG